jgi:hypothetical protein
MWNLTKFQLILLIPVWDALQYGSIVVAVSLSQLALLLQLKESACYFCTANQLEIKY